ncbi:MAG TPA: alpha/beta hydrolase [Candidatus Dormibacteraeota bacterium]|nr:alpha/beta hydrolase [Candidatus Dormibacteraeota bacterium]
MAPEAGKHTKGFLSSSDGTRLAYRAWPVTGSTITFAVVHGLGEHSGRYQRFAGGMAKHRMATYALDLRGHGESAGRRGHVDAWTQWVDDAATFVQHVEEQTSNEVVPLGHSFGGVVMLSAVRSARLTNARHFIVSSPALRLTKEVPQVLTQASRLLSSVAPKLALANNVDPKTVSRIPEIVDAYRTDPLVHGKITTRLYTEWRRAGKENLEHAADIKLPFLIIAGSADPLIDPEGSRELHRRAPASQLEMLEGRYHEPFNDLGSDEVFQLIADWLQPQP